MTTGRSGDESGAEPMDTPEAEFEKGRPQARQFVALLVITAAAQHDLANAARRLEWFMHDLDEGRYPEDVHADGSP